VLVKNNLIDTYCTAKHDGGAIYAYGERNRTNRRVIGNIALRGIGDRTGLIGNAGNTHGIYMDGGTRNVEITGNTSAFNDASGLELNDADHVQVRDNLFFDNKVAQMYINDRDTAYPVRALQISNNILFSAQPQQLIAFLNSSGNNLRNAGTINNNVYARPSFEPTGVNTTGYSRVDQYFTDGGIIYDEINGQWRFLSLDAWQGLSGQDSQTVKTQGGVAANAAVLFEFNASKVTKTVALVGSYVDARGRAYSGSVTLPPYSSVVLIRK